jgi:hypothetical protein
MQYEVGDAGACRTVLYWHLPPRRKPIRDPAN